MFSTSWVEEYGRTYVETVCHGNENLLVPSDFHKIAIEHKRLEEEAARTANRVVICDTNALITQYYHSLMFGYHDSTIEELLRNGGDDYDLYIFLRGNVPWIDDGIRQHNDVDGDYEFKLESMVELYIKDKSKVVFVEENTYTERMNKSVEIIKNLLLHNN